MQSFRKIIYLVVVALLFSQCKAYQVTTKPTDMQYSNFTAKQKKWDSPEGAIAYIDKGEGMIKKNMQGVF